LAIKLKINNMTSRTNLIINVMYALSAFTVLLGAFLRIINYTNSNLLIIIGFVAGALTICYDSIRLKRRIKQLEEQLKLKEK